MATTITLNLRQEVLATATAYVAVSEITSVSGLIGAAATDAQAPFVISRQNDGTELYDSIVKASELGTIPISDLVRFDLVWNTFDPNNLTSVSRIKVYFPEYWKTRHAGVLDGSGTAGALAVFGNQYTFTDTGYNAFSALDIGKKIEITSGNNVGMYDIVGWSSVATVILAPPLSLLPESGISWNKYDYGPFTYIGGVTTDTSGSWSTPSSGGLPSQVPRVSSDTITLDLLDSGTNIVQGNVKATVSRRDITLSKLRDKVVYTFHGSFGAAENQNNLVLTNLKTYVNELNSAGGLVGTHTVVSTVV